MKIHNKQKHADDQDRIISTALTLAVDIGFQNLTRENVAAACEVSPATINVKFGTLTDFRRTLMRHAVRRECLPVIAYGLATDDKHAMKAAPELRRRAALHIA